MVLTHFRIALRRLARHKQYTLLNVGGLAVAIGSCLLIGLYINDEVGYDRMHTKADRTYRVTTQPEGFPPSVNVPPAVGPALQQQFPAIEQSTRVFRHWFSPLIVAGETGFIEEQFFFADSTFLAVFSFPLVRGDRQAALREPFAVLLTESTAKKYFGTDDPVGKRIRYNAGPEFTVTGILADIPHASHFRPAFVASMSSLPSVLWPTVLRGFGLGAFKTYVVLHDPAAAPGLEQELRGFYGSLTASSKATLGLQPLLQIHLHSQLAGEFEPNGDVRYIYILLAIAAVILAIACINYTNLTIAQSARRAREIGVRKVTGAGRASLAGQFIGESALMVTAAALVALGMAEILVPFLNTLTGKELSLLPFLLGRGGLILPAVIVLLTLGAGVYPALVAARLEPVAALRGYAGRGRNLLRQALVVLQFAAGIALVIGAMVIREQLAFVQSTNLGFQKDQVLVVRVQDDAVAANSQGLRAEFLQEAGVQEVAWANALPGKGHAGDRFRWEGSSDRENLPASVNWVDDHFMHVLGLQLAAGRDFDAGRDFGTEKAAILNETAVRTIGWKSPEEALGKSLSGGGSDRGTHRIIGVVRDFHFESLHHPVVPLVMFPQASAAYLLVRVRPEHMRETIARLDTRWRRVAAAQPFSYTFLDEEFDRQYRADERLGSLVGAAAVLAVVTACLGLFGLASLIAGQRTKEIGVRKVLGASVPGVVGLLSREFVRLVVIANLVAWPVAYVAAHRWLQDFAYRIEPGPGSFLLAGALAVAIAFATVSMQAVKAALMNPVTALRYE